jgi:peptidoglycan/xylan/chitin deacetylase (PgdA/CDA1 family)
MKIRIAIWMLALLVCARFVMAFTGCPGDVTNTTVVTEYIFHEGAGNTAYNTGTGDGPGDATLTNGVVFSADVPPANTNCGYSVNFPSSGSGSTTPALETSGSYDPLAGANKFTIMAWVKRESLSVSNNTAARIVSDIDSLGSTASGFEFRFSGQSGLLTFTINGKDHQTSTGGIAPNSNAWHHVAVVYDGTRPATNALTRHVHFYVDGVQRGLGVSNSTLNVSVSANTNRLTIGNSSVGRGVGNLLVGKIDDVRILRGFAPAAVGDGKTNDVIRCFMNASDDFEPPTIACPADLTVGTDAGQCFASGIALGSAAANDNCGVVTVTNDAPVVFARGTTLVTWTATDASGNAARCQQTVTVVDNEAPSISCPSDVTVNTGGACAASGVTLGQPTVSDNCPGVSATNDAPATFPVGMTIVTWIAVDTSSNSNTCQQLVTVVDNHVPTLVCPSTVTVNANTSQCFASSVNLGQPTISNNCGVATLTNNAPATFAVGTNTVTWMVVDSNGSSNTCPQTVVVIDNQPPTIDCPSDVTVDPDPGESFASHVNFGQPTASDNCAVGSVSSNAPSVFDRGSTLVTWMATDAAGNQSSCQQTVTVSTGTGCAGDVSNSAVIVEYLFREGTGTNTLNTGTDGASGNATLKNGASFSTNVPPSNTGCGWSVSLPNSGSGSGTPAVQTSADYNPLAGAERFTIMAWVKRESSAANQNTYARIVSDEHPRGLGGNSGFAFRFSGQDGQLALRVNDDEAVTSISGGLIPANDGQWHFVAVAYDGLRPSTNGLTRHVHFYVDGIQRGLGGELPGQIVETNDYPLTIGNASAQASASTLMVGKISEVRILRDFAPDAVGINKTNEIIRCYMNHSDGSGATTCSISGPDSVCAGSTNTVYSGPAGMTSYSWSISGGTIDGPTTEQNVSVTAGSGPSLTLTLTGTNAAGCSSTCTKTVIVNPRPACEITGSDSVCGQSAHNVYSGPSGTGLSYDWAISGNGTIVGPSNGQAVSISAGATGSFSLTVTLTDDAGCASTCTKPVSVNPSPDATIAASSSVCENSTANTASVPDAGAGATYTWTIGNGTIDSGQGTRSIGWSASATSPVTLGVTVTSGGCSSTGTRNVTVNPFPDATITAPDSVCATATSNIASVPDAGQGATYSWTILNGAIQSGNGTRHINWSAGSVSPVTLSVTVTADGCSSVGSKDVMISDPCSQIDTDGDGMPDWWEIAHGLDPTLNDAELDPDGDGLTNLQEYRYFVPSIQEYQYGTDPHNPDTDGDGLTDGQEVDIYGTDPRNPDSDIDSLSDGDEVNVYGTDPKNPDTDGDTIPDDEEIRLGLNPREPDDLNSDADGDGFTLEEELINETDPNDPNSNPDQDTVNPGQNSASVSSSSTSCPDTVPVSFSASVDWCCHESGQIRLKLGGLERVFFAPPSFGTGAFNNVRLKKGRLYQSGLKFAEFPCCDGDELTIPVSFDGPLLVYRDNDWHAAPYNFEFTVTEPVIPGYSTLPVNETWPVAVPKVDLELSNKSPTVADGGAIQPMDECKEESDGAEIRINADFDEDNKSASGKPVEDFRADASAGHRIAPTDPDLLDGRLKIDPATTPPLTGTWKLTFPDKVKVWMQDGSTWQEVISDQPSGSVPLSVNLPLKVEGISGSLDNKDVRVATEFVPDGASFLVTDTARVTVVESQFMLTFDDGPYAVKTPRILNALQQVYVNGSKVKAAFFEVGMDGSESGVIDKFLWPKEGVDDNPTITQQVEADGHVVGNHTQHHQEFDPGDPVAEVTEEIANCNTQITMALGHAPPKQFRPPYLVNTQNVIDGADISGFQIIWGKTFGEANPALFLSFLKSNVKDYLKDWNTKAEPQRKTLPTILIFHDYRDLIYDHIGEIVDELRASGFELVPYDNLKAHSDLDYYQ